MAHDFMESNEAHVWVAELAVLTAADVSRCDAVLSAGERERMQRFHFQRDREIYRAAHGLARLALSRCAPSVDPRDWTFVDDAHGKPEVAAPQRTPRLRFNISHTHGLVACVIAEELDCGVDVERTWRDKDLIHVARRVLTPAELSAVAGLQGEEQALLFCRYWTLKEAYAKARGLGMSLAFDQLAMDVDPPRLLSAAAHEWTLEQWPATPEHLVAVAVHRPGVQVVRHGGLPGER
ncbi:MAG TPA: 4'-phosphopantetheinyl transferase superfamily protein [Thermoanaerobaculia bacterium]